MARKQQKRFARLRVMDEYGSSGVWAAEQVGPFRRGMVRHSTLSLPHDLATRFNAWIGRYWLRREAGFDTASFNSEGLELAQAIEHHVGPETEVVFTPEAEDGGLLPEQLVKAEPLSRLRNTNKNVLPGTA
jgi:hypothetical protein